MHNATIFEASRLEFTDVTGLAMPPLGAKCHLIDRKGVFVFERGGGTLRTIACTHAGSGTFVALDVLVDDNGKFIGPSRVLYKANPVVMGSWMLDAGFVNGLVLQNFGGPGGISALASIVWLPVKQKK